MPQVIFSHKKIKEREYLKQLLEEQEWFESENFDVFLPKNRSAVGNEIRKKNESLNKKIMWLRNEWGKVEKDYFTVVKKFRHKKIQLLYDCHVSRFGPEGKYRPPNMLFIRLRTKKDKQRILETIGHELLHLIFADYFKQNKLNYAEREGMIDTIILYSDLMPLFPRYQKQSIGKVRKKLLESIL